MNLLRLPSTIHRPCCSSRFCSDHAIAPSSSFISKPSLSCTLRSPSSPNSAIPCPRGVASNSAPCTPVSACAAMSHAQNFVANRGKKNGNLCRARVLKTRRPSGYGELPEARRSFEGRALGDASSGEAEKESIAKEVGKKEGVLVTGSPIVIVEAPVMLKTAEPMPMMRPNRGLIKPGDAGRVLDRRPKDVWAVRFAVGAYLIDRKYFKPIDTQ